MEIDCNLEELKDAAVRARSAYRWDEAIRIYSDALACPDLEPEIEFDLLEQREYCWNRIARFDRAAADAERLVALAAAIGDTHKDLTARTLLAISLSYAGETEAAEAAASETRRLAKKSGDAYFEARAGYALGLAALNTGNYNRSAADFSEARRIFKSLDRKADEAWCLYHIAYCASYTGHDPVPLAEEMQQLTAGLDDPLLKARTQHMLAITHANDPSRRRHYLEQSLETYHRIDERAAIAATLHNLGVFYQQTSLYKRGYELLSQAARLQEAQSHPSRLLTRHMAAFVGHLAGQDPDAMLSRNLQVFEEASETGEKNIAAFTASVRGVMLHRAGRNEEAAEWLERADRLLEVAPGYAPLNHAFLGSVFLETGQTEKALQATADAADWASELADVPLRHFVLWSHYRARRTAAAGDAEISAGDWELLNQAAGLILDAGENIRDSGLRRTYLIHGLDTADLLIEWTRQAFARGAALDRLYPELAAGEEIRDPFKRLVEFGNRLTSQRSLNDLPGFIMDEFVELSGAERAFIALDSGETGDPEIVQAFGIDNEAIRIVRDESAAAFDRSRLSHQPLILSGIGAYPEGEPPPVHQRSALILPLVQADRVLGVIYADAREVFGPFTRAEADLLGVLANQAAAALENARWSEGLEQQVAERTHELSQRNAEMAIVNSVQQGLASKLDIDAIYKLVGEELRKVFHTDVVVAIYDAETDTATAPYAYEAGQMHAISPFKVGGVGFIGEMVRNPSTILVNEDFEAASEKYNSRTVEDTGAPKSVVYVPLVADGVLSGVLILQDMEDEHAFSGSDVRLLETIADSMSVALENARLFAETQRLLKETEERNAEMAIINSVQEGLVAQIDIQGIYDLVGTQISKVFPEFDVDLRIIIPGTGLVLYPYCMENGRQIKIEPQTLSGLTEHIYKTGQTILINENVVEEAAKYGSSVIPGTSIATSVLMVPLQVGAEVKGGIYLQHMEKEHAFSDSDVRLLTTLANSMSVALENARLFDETQRLLEETEARNAELAVINSVQEGLVSKLEIQDIYDLVGETIRAIFDAQVLVIQEYDHARRQRTERYAYEKGVRFPVETEPFNDVDLYMIEHKTTIDISENLVERFKELFGRAPEVAGGEIPKSACVVPMLLGDQVLGAIQLRNIDREHAFTDSDRRLLHTLANSMVVALENARLFEETSRRANEMAALTEIGREISSTLEQSVVLERIATQARDLLKARDVVIRLLGLDGETLEAVVALGPYADQYRASSARLGEGITGDIAVTGVGEIINQPSKDRRARHVPGTPQAEEDPDAIMIVPLQSGNAVIGTMGLWRTRETGLFTAADLSILESLARQASIAILNAQLYEVSQRRAEEMAALAEIGNEIATTLEMTPVLEQIAEKAADLLRVRDIAVFLLEPDGETLKVPVARGTYSDEMVGISVRIGEGFTGTIAASGVPEIVNHPNSDPRGKHIDGTPEEEEIPLMAAPLLSRGKTIGVLTAWSDGAHQPFTQSDLDFLVSLARQAAIAIESARLYLETQTRAEELAALNRIGQEIASTLDLQTVLERVSENALELLGGSTSAVYLTEANGKTMRCNIASGSNADEIRNLEIPLGEGILGSVAKNARAEIINDTNLDDRAIHIPGTDADDEGEKLVVAPLMSKGKVLGIMAVWRDAGEPVFDAAGLNVLIGLAQQAAVSVENASLFEEVERQRQYSEALVQNSPVAIVTTDLEANVVSWNPAAENLFGYEVYEAVGKNLDSLIAANGEIMDEAAEITRQTAQEIRINTVTQRARKDGTRVDVELLALPVVLNGERVGIIAIYHDISALLEARKLAESANEAKSAFLATMSHEIRTPMNAIIGMSGLLMDTDLSAEQHEFADVIRTSGDALLAIINDILDFSKIEAGRMDLEEEPVDLREMLETSIDLIRIPASQKGLDLAYEMAEDLPPAILSDATRLRQILINLLNNAVKFTQTGEVVLSVAPCEGGRGDEEIGRGVDRETGKQVPVYLSTCLHFSVRDTGIGIPADRAGRLFQAFSQVDASTSRRYGGTGLGLAISKSLAELMGGEMWVESVEGEGSTFHFTIRAEPAPELETREHLTGEQPELSGKRLLVVDDSPTNRRILALQTKNWGMLARDTDSPAQALKWLERGDPFDLAIIDMHMPGMEGVELAERIKTLPGRADLPLILFSSLSGRELKLEDSPFADHLQKPLKQSLLYDTLMNVFSTGPVAGRRSPVRSEIDTDLAERLPLRILLTEDNAVNQKVALRILERMGFRADVAANGLEALEAVQRQPYDVVLMDVQMPEMDGLEATRRIRGLDPKGLKDLWGLGFELPRIIAMTANATEEDRRACFEAGMDDYIAKPIRVEELAAALERSRSDPKGLGDL